MENELDVKNIGKKMQGICTFCDTLGNVRTIAETYYWNDNVEIYEDMLSKCFAINISEQCKSMDHELSIFICDNCVERLRDALCFRELVERGFAGVEKKLIYAHESKATHYMETIKEEILITESGDLVLDSDDDNNCSFENYENENKDLVEREEEFLDILTHPKEEIRTKESCSKQKKINSTKKNQRKTTKKSTGRNTLNAEQIPFKWYKKKFRCVICSYDHNTLDELRIHMSTHDPAEVKQAFKQDKSLMTTRAALHCKYCSMNVFSFDKLKDHYAVCKKKIKQSSITLHDPDKCRYCNMDVTGFVRLKDHYAVCRERATKFGRRSMLPYKLDKNSRECNICNETFLNYVTLNIHMNKHFPNFICETCGKAFASSSRLKSHVRIHETGEFPCKECDRVFSKATQREQHMARVHKSGVRYSCPRCGIALHSFYARMKHLADIHDEELKRYKCKLCTQRYITPGHLSSHVRKDHLNERNHSCPKCDAKFYSSNVLKSHMVKHDGERIYACSVCSKAYQRMKTLREHMRIHTNDKRFVCPVCGRAFTQKCTLMGHLFRVHKKRNLDEEEYMAGSKENIEKSL